MRYRDPQLHQFRKQTATLVTMDVRSVWLCQVLNLVSVTLVLAVR